MIELFIWDYCPFCRKILKHLKEIGFTEHEDYELVDARPGTPGQKVLIEIGGKSQVPFLKDNDVLMYESLDIIDYLNQKKSRADA